MKRPSEEQLRALSQEELIELFYTMFDRFEQKIAELQAKIDGLKRPPTTSKNSSQPPSRDFKTDWDDRDNDTHAPAKKRGARDGHAMMRREMVDGGDARRDHCGTI